MNQRPQPIVKHAALGGLVASALLVAGCGSSSPSPKPSDAKHVAAAPGPAPAPALPARRREDGKATRRNVHPHPSTRVDRGRGSSKITKAGRVQKPTPGTGGATANDDNDPAGQASRADTGRRPTTSGQPDPCALVSRTQASAFTGQAVAVKEAPLGPTCIYAAPKGSAVTMAVQWLRFSAVKPHMKVLSKQTIAGLASYCGVYGSPVTYVVLSQTRVLSISAPCGVGAKFASAALPKLRS